MKSSPAFVTRAVEALRARAGDAWVRRTVRLVHGVDSPRDIEDWATIEAVQSAEAGVSPSKVVDVARQRCGLRWDVRDLIDAVWHVREARRFRVAAESEPDPARRAGLMELHGEHARGEHVARAAALHRQHLEINIVAARASASLAPREPAHRHIPPVAPMPALQGAHRDPRARRSHRPTPTRGAGSGSEDEGGEPGEPEEPFRPTSDDRGRALLLAHLVAGAVVRQADADRLDLTGARRVMTALRAVTARLGLAVGETKAAARLGWLAAGGRA